MKARLLKKLRKEIFENSDVELINGGWSCYLTTRLKGEYYVGPIVSTLAIYMIPGELGRELAHIALQGFIESKIKKKCKR